MGAGETALADMADMLYAMASESWSVRTEK
jgi:hypothetical protein